VERPLEGKVALVTGGGVRLGRAIAEGLGRAGASVAVHYHQSREGADQAVQAIQADGNRACALRADLGQSAQAEALAAQAERALGPVSILINSAALLEGAPLVETTDESLDRLWTLNARGPYVLTRAIARRMRGRGGDVVNLVDIYGSLLTWRNHSAYCMTKAAVAELTRCLAVELAPEVRVNAVSPGAALPPVSLQPEEREAIRQRVPQKRFGTPADIVGAVLFLVTGPRFITGQIIAVDGGRTAANGA
jgi:pteridine reductase